MHYQNENFYCKIGNFCSKSTKEEEKFAYLKKKM